MIQGIKGDIQWDTGGYRGIQGLQRDAEKYRDIEEYWGYRLIKGIQRNTGDTKGYRGYRGYRVVAHSKRQYSINLREK